MAVSEEFRRCECGFWLRVSDKQCLNCGWTEAEFKHEQGGESIVLGVLLASLSGLVFVSGLAPKEFSLGLSATGLVGLLISALLILPFFHRRVQTERRWLQDRAMRNFEPWRTREKLLEERLDPLVSRQKKIESHLAKVRAEEGLEPDLRKNLEHTLTAAEQATSKLRRTLEKQVQVFRFMRWQNQWAPLPEMLRKMSTEKEARSVTHLLKLLRIEAGNLSADLPGLEEAKRDLDGLIKKLEKRLQNFRSQELLSTTIDLVRDVQPIDPEILPAATTLPALSLEGLSWYCEPAEMTAQAEELEEELRRLQSEMAVDDAFPLEGWREQEEQEWSL